jgi:hypothetical protein
VMEFSVRATDTTKSRAMDRRIGHAGGWALCALSVLVVAAAKSVVHSTLESELAPHGDRLFSVQGTFAGSRAEKLIASNPENQAGTHAFAAPGRGKQYLDDDEAVVERLDVPVQPKTYLERISDALAGFVIGWILVLMSIPFLFLIEAESVFSLAMISRAKRSCIQVMGDRVASTHQNCMVHVSGRMTAEVGQRDSSLAFAPAEKAIVLKRTVEVLQWVEEVETDKETNKKTYLYRKAWREDDVNSDSFHDTMKQNPPRRKEFHTEVFMDADVNLGAYKLKRNVLSMLKDFEHCTLEHNSPPAEFKLKGRFYCLGSGEQTGDMRIFYKVGLALCIVVTELDRGLTGCTAGGERAACDHLRRSD